MSFSTHRFLLQSRRIGRASVFRLRKSSLRLFATNTNSTNHNQNDTIKTYEIQGVGRRSRVEITTAKTNHALTTDVPRDMGGQDSAPQPVEVLLAALLGCTQATAVFVGRHMTPRVLIDRLEMSIVAERNEQGALQLPITNDPDVPSRLHSIFGTIRVYPKPKDAQLSREQLHILSHQTELRCPVANMMVASGCTMDIEWVDGRALPALNDNKERL